MSFALDCPEPAQSTPLTTGPAKRIPHCEKLFDELFGKGPTPQTRHLLEAISNNAELDG